jgi:hypothetical protein
MTPVLDKPTYQVIRELLARLALPSKAPDPVPTPDRHPSIVALTEAICYASTVAQRKNQRTIPWL